MDKLIPIVGTMGLLGSALVGGIFFAFSSFIMKALAGVPSAEGVGAKTLALVLCLMISGGATSTVIVAEGEAEFPPPVPSIADLDFWEQRIWLDDDDFSSHEVVAPAIFFGMADSKGSASIEYELKGEGAVYLWRNQQWESVKAVGHASELSDTYLAVIPVSAATSSSAISIWFQAGPIAPAAATKTTAANLFPDPTPPYRWNLFSPWPVSGAGITPPVPLTPPVDALFPIGSAVGCATEVVIPNGITAKLSGTTTGALGYNGRPRGGGNYPSVNGGKKTLGGFRDTLNWMSTRIGYKYEVSVTFQGPLKDAFYGQLISGPHSLDVTKPVHAKFRDDGPANDWVGKTWNLKPGETKAAFPVIEVVGQTVRWIDAPGGSPFSVQGTYHIVILYAGACGAVEDIEILLVKYPAPLLTPTNIPGRGEAFTITPRALLNLADSIRFH